MSFAEATGSVASDQANRRESEIHPGWDIAGNANGGYLLVVAGRAMASVADRPDVATITAHYLRPGTPGPASVECTVLKHGRRFTSVQATLAADKPILGLIGSFTDLEASPPEREVLLRTAPDWPDVEDQPRVREGDMFPPPAMERIDLRLHPEDNFYNGPSGQPRMRGWVRLLDDEQWDTFGLLLAADIFPPTVFNADFNIGWVPTIELTVHVRNRPAPGWLRCEFESRFVTGGYVEEDGLIWDSNDQLVAQSRQISLLPR